MNRETMQKTPSVARSLGPIIEDVVLEPESEVPIEFRKGEIETVHKVLDRIDQVAAKRVSEGFSKRNFQLGVLNYIMISFVFGKYPQHFWLVFLIELSVLIPMKMIGSYNAKPLCQVLYFLDYCWVMNLFGIFVGICLFVDMVTPEQLISEKQRHELFVTVYGISCGPLLGATILLPFVAVVFHDFAIMTGLFIHILPPMVMYTLRWNYQEIHDAWPHYFKLSYMDDLKFFPDDGWLIIPGTGLGTIAGNTIAFYFLWFVPYLFWMLLIGMDLPRKDRKRRNGTVIVPVYDTVFHSTVRTGLTVVAGKALWGRPEEVSKVQVENDDYETKDFLVYIGMHAILACSSVYFLAYPCFLNQKVHAFMLIILTIICVARGAARYTYYVTEMYQHSIRKDFAPLFSEAKKNK